jgi:exonuclease-1
VRFPLKELCKSNFFCFRDLEDGIAKRLASGDVDPISLLPMDDINPSYIPRMLKTAAVNPLEKASTKGKSRPMSSILDFFGNFLVVLPCRN